MYVIAKTFALDVPYEGVYTVTLWFPPDTSSDAGTTAVSEVEEL